MIAMNQVSKQGKGKSSNGVVVTDAAGASGRGRNVGNGEVVATGKRRRFSQAYKQRILAEADACRHGELGALLRREGLYSSYIATWRQERAANKWETSKRKNGKERTRLEQLEKENARLQKELKQAQAIITAQKKLADLIDMLNESK